MTGTLDLTASRPALANAAARLVRLLAARPLRPALAGVLLTADEHGLQCTATDGEITARVRVPAVVHEFGQVIVARRVLADTLAALDVPEVRLAVEGARLAVRTPSSRFALPRLADDYPQCTELPPSSGHVDAAAFQAAAIAVASAASRDNALPIFTGVRIRSDADRLTLVATDRYKMAVAELAWSPAGVGHGCVDVLVSAAALAEMGKQASGRVEMHTGAGLLGLSWTDGSILVPVLGQPFPDAQLGKLLEISAESTVEVDADALVSVLERAVPYGGAHSRVAIEVDDGGLIVRASDPLSGEAEERLKASAQGGRVTRFYQAHLLVQALRPFTRRSVRLRVQDGIRPTELTLAPAEEQDLGLRYLVVPMRVTASA